MTSITWAGPRCVQELATILAPQNRTQGRCAKYIIIQGSSLEDHYWAENAKTLAKYEIFLISKLNIFGYFWVFLRSDSYSKTNALPVKKSMKNSF